MREQEYFIDHIVQKLELILDVFPVSGGNSAAEILAQMLKVENGVMVGLKDISPIDDVHQIIRTALARCKDILNEIQLTRGQEVL